MSRHISRLGLGGVALAALLLALPGTGAAAETVAADDARWLPWIGCWESSEGEEEQGDALLVCFRYLTDGTGVEIVTYSEGEEIAREEVRADGVRSPVADGGCEGERWARFSNDGRRVFLRSQMSCGEGINRATRGVLSIQQMGNRWVELHAVEAGDTDPMIGLRSFYPAPDSELARLGIESPVRGRALAVSTARAQASRPVTVNEVAELHGEIGAFGTQAYLVHQGEGFELSTAQLRQLKRAGVGEEVLDIMVGLSFPERFAIRDDGSAAPRPAAEATRQARGPVRVLGYSPWGGNYYGYGSYRYSPYGYYGGYGNGYGYGYPGGRYAPPVIIVNPPTVEDRNPARVLPGRGYVAPTRSGTPAQASQGTAGSGTTQPSTARPSTSSGTASPPPPPPVRRAIPRPPPDPDPQF